VVWYLDTTKLNHAAATLTLPDPPAPDGEVRPFVCLSARAGTSTWAEITTQPRPYRLELAVAWLVTRSGSLLQGGTRSWLNGAVYVGEDEAFCDAVANTSDNQFSAAAVARMLAYLQQITDHRRPS